MLDPDAVAARTFGTSFRGYDPEEVRRFLTEIAGELRSLAAGVLEGLDDDRAAALVGEEAGRLLNAARATAADVVAKADERAAEVLREAQEEALRLRSTVEAERDRALADGALRAEEALAAAELARSEVEAAAKVEADRLVAEAVAAREHVLRDLARRRTAVRAQVEQLHAAREKLLESLGDIARSVDEARGRLVVALPEAKVAADAAARRVQGEPELTVEQLESELEAFRLAGIPLLPGEEPAPEAEAEALDAAITVDAVEAPPEPEPELRPSSAVRVFRARRDPAPALGLGEPDLHPVEPNAPFEEVRVLPATDERPAPARNGHADPDAADDEAETAQTGHPEPDRPDADADAADDEAETAQTGHPEPDRPDADADAAAADEEAEPARNGHAEPDRPAADAVDALFARLRAGREERTSAAEEVLSEPTVAPAATATAVVVDEVAVHVGGGADRQALLARRDELLAGPTSALTRRLKRLLADEQNAVLDALRRQGPVAASAALDDLASRWGAAAAADLGSAASAGAVFIGGDGIEDVDLGEVATELAAAIAVPLGTKLADGIRRAEGDAEVAAEAVRSTCREWRTRRLADGVDHAVRAAFGRGELAATPAGSGLCWIVDDGGSPCPDAEDNALAGVVPAGEPFPTGHVAPPAHPGCRCVLARPV